jgi:hypothetical protein
MAHRVQDKSTIVRSGSSTSTSTTSVVAGMPRVKWDAGRVTAAWSGSVEQAFDLNIGKVLEHWTMPFAIRELIANALDEQVLTGSREPVISRDGSGRWRIADAGRGIRYEHLTQNESAEKHRHPNVIGQFGMGLKDALAVFDRRGVPART